MWPKLISDFLRWQGEVRGLAAETIYQESLVLKRFAKFLRRQGIRRLCQLVPSTIDAFVKHDGKRMGAPGLRNIVHSLRAFLRFLEVRGLARPGAHLWPMRPRAFSMAHIPRFLDRATVRQMLGAVDRSTLVGKRDYAVIMLMLGLGLRRGEVLRLRLCDYRSEARQLFVRRGKSGRSDRLPVPSEVVAALDEYLRARPKPSSASDPLFLTTLRPILGIGRNCVWSAVSRALRSSGLTPGSGSPHRLRHTFAQHLLDNGAPLEAIRELLGHRLPSTTAIYAKVSLKALREVAENDANDL